MVNTYLLGKKLLNYFTECLYYFTLPETIYESSRSSISFSELGTTSIFNFIHFKRSIVVSYPGLNFRFPIGWCWSSVLVCYQYILFDKGPSLSSFLNFFTVESQEFFIYWNQDLSVKVLVWDDGIGRSWIHLPPQRLESKTTYEAIFSGKTERVAEQCKQEKKKIKIGRRYRDAITSWTPPCPHQGFPGGSDGKESACNAADLGSIPELGRSPKEGNGYPLRYSCLENSMDEGAWWATVHRVAKSRTRLSD